MRSPRSLGQDFGGGGDAGSLDCGDDFGLLEEPISAEFITWEPPACYMGPEGSGSKWRYSSCFFSEAKAVFFRVCHWINTGQLVAWPW